MGIGRKTKVIDTVTTTDAGITSTVVSDLLSYDNILILIEEENTNAVEYQVEVTPAYYANEPIGSDDTTTKWHTLLSWTDLAKDGEISLALTNAWDAIRVKVRSDVSSTHGVVSVWINRK